MTGDFRLLLDHALCAPSSGFVLLHRPRTDPEQVELLVGDFEEYERVADLPLSERGPSVRPRHELFAMVPFRQIAERGFECHDDGAPLLAMTVTEQAACPVAEATQLMPNIPISLSGRHFDIEDDEYAMIVRRILEREIGRGRGANFVIKRSFVADVSGFTPRTALSLFRRMLGNEQGAYWTFAAQLGERTFVGATPERHVSLVDGTAVMNPISGTFRYRPEGPRLEGLLEFLANPKETSELFMVLDEELKMLSRISDRGVHATGPFLREMAALAHTEYLIEGKTDRDVRQVLRETMFAPTVTGSPVENACRVIHEHEASGRGYYSGIAALVSTGAGGGRELDSAIVIRTAEINAERLRLTVGATLVRDSDPVSEVAETHAKVEGALRALGVRKEAPRSTTKPKLHEQPDVGAALERRNDLLARYWLDGDASTVVAEPGLVGKHVLVVDAEDTFTAMLSHQLGTLGLHVDLCDFTEKREVREYDMVVMGPGPGDPADVGNPKIAALHGWLHDLFDAETPFLAVCLSHQVLGGLLGFKTIRKTPPNQGAQHEIDFFGRHVVMGFYNTFALRSDTDRIHCPITDDEVLVSRDRGTGHVHGLRGRAFRSVQFHLESILSRDGLSVLTEQVAALLSE